MFYIISSIYLHLHHPEGRTVAGSRRRKLEQTVASLRRRYGDDVIRRGGELPSVSLPPHLSTGFPALDELTGCGGIPLGRLTLLTGRTTSGKLTVAYKTLATLLQRSARATALLLDLTHTCDPDYLARCGVRLDALTLVRPTSSRQAVDLLLDLLQQNSVDAILVDSLPHLMANRADTRYFNSNLAALNRLLLASRTALIVLDEPQAPWLNWFGLQRAFDLNAWTALHLSLKREQWIYRHEQLVGYQATAHRVKSRWAQGRASAAVTIHFNGTVRAGQTW